MRGIRRKLVAAVTTAVFGSLTVLGSALHTLPGLNHSCCGTCAHHEAHGGEAIRCDCQQCFHRPGHGHSADDCPICSFLAMAKTVAATSPGVVVSGAVEFLLPAEYQCLVGATYSPYSARGPPVAGILLA